MRKITRKVMGGSGSTTADWMDFTVVCVCINCSPWPQVQYIPSLNMMHQVANMMRSYQAVINSSVQSCTTCTYAYTRAVNCAIFQGRGVQELLVRVRKICKNGGYMFHQGSILQTCQSLATHLQQSVCQHCKAVSVCTLIHATYRNECHIQVCCPKWGREGWTGGGLPACPLSLSRLHPLTWLSTWLTGY